MGKTVEFFFDVGSPASYLAWTQLPTLCATAGAELVYKPMLLGGVYQATGNASPATIPAKGAYTVMDYARHARRYGVPYQHNPHFPIITLTLMRAVTGMQMRQPERLQDFMRAVFKALWVDGLNLNDPQLVAKQQSEFQVRWSPDIADLSPLDRITYGGSVYDIAAVHEIGRREGLRVIAVRRTDTT